MGSAALLPVNLSTAATLWDLAARDSGITVNPRVATVDPSALATVQTAYVMRAAGRPLPGQHDPIVDVGRNDFYRVLAVVDATGFAAECRTITFARGLGMYRPRIERYVRATRVRTILERVTDNVATDRVCPTDGVLTYIVDDTDQLPYRVTQWSSTAPIAEPAANSQPVRRGRPRG
jgi:hypothetical protein